MRHLSFTRKSSDSPVSTIRERYAGIDMLRGVAILMVVFYHFTTRYFDAYNFAETPDTYLNFPGWLGVDLFFIISGYCISLTVEKIHTLSGFWAARFSRLQPAYMACAILTFVTLLLFPMPDGQASVVQLIGNFLWLNTVPNLIPPIDGVYWSLIVEMKFYFYFGLFWFIHHNPKRILHFFTALVLLGIITQEMGKNLDIPEIAQLINEHILIFPYSALFLFGIALQHFSDIRTREAISYFVLSVVCILICDRYEDVLLYALALLPLSVLFIRLKNRFSFQPLIFIGIMSYSWYLLHQMIGYTIMTEMYQSGFHHSPPYIAALLTFFLAVLINLSFEHSYREPFYRFFKSLFVYIGFKK